MNMIDIVLNKFNSEDAEKYFKAGGYYIIESKDSLRINDDERFILGKFNCRDNKIIFYPNRDECHLSLSDITSIAKVNFK